MQKQEVASLVASAALGLAGMSEIPFIPANWQALAHMAAFMLAIGFLVLAIFRPASRWFAGDTPSGPAVSTRSDQSPGSPATSFGGDVHGDVHIHGSAQVGTTLDPVALLAQAQLGSEKEQRDPLALPVYDPASAQKIKDSKRLETLRRVETNLTEYLTDGAALDSSWQRGVKGEQIALDSLQWIKTTGDKMWPWSPNEAKAFQAVVGSPRQRFTTAYAKLPRAIERLRAEKALYE